MKIAFLTRPVPHETARRSIADKPAVSRDVFDRLPDEMRARAFTITGIEDFDVMQGVRDELATLPAGADSGNHTCDPYGGTDPSGEILFYIGNEGLTAGTTTHTRTASADTVTTPYSDIRGNTASADTEYFAWQTVFQEWNVTGSFVEKTEYSDNLNTGSTAVAAMWTDLETEIAALNDSFGWGITIPGIFTAGNAGEIKSFYPVTNGTQTIPDITIWVRARQLRIQWTTPEDHSGEKYRVGWDWAFFPAAWEEWRADYYTWAVEKYAYITKPEPGDDDYPVLADFAEDPDPAAALAAAIAAIDAIEDPGAAPEEPEAIPEIIDSHTWEWLHTQPTGPFEEIPACDPTAEDRAAPEEPAPLGEDPTPEEEAAHAEAQAIYDAAVALTARQSPWTIHTPVEPPTEPGVWRVANVHYVCGETPNGLIKNYDPRFPTTTLPPLDPTEFDPAIRSVWYD